MFDVLTLWLIIWVVKNAAMDVSCAVTGKPNPRYELKKAKARAAGLAAPAQHRYGTRDWFDDLLADGLQAQTERRRRKAAQKRAARDNADALDADEDLDLPLEAAEESKPVVHTGGGTRLSDEGAGLWSWTCKREGCPGKGFNFATQAAAQAAAAEHLQRLHAGTASSASVQTDLPVPAGRPVAETVPPGPAATPGTETSGPATGGQPGPEPHQQPAPVTPAAAEDGPTARVYQFPNTTTQEETVSTDVNAEVVGLEQSIAYARQLAAFAGEHGMAGNEGYVGHLTDSQVSGEALASAGEMQEAFANAQAAAERHAELLEAQRAVQEAYDNNADAGDKAFMQDGR